MVLAWIRLFRLHSLQILADCHVDLLLHWIAFPPRDGCIPSIGAQIEVEGASKGEKGVRT
jgi:hypothetical protein